MALGDMLGKLGQAANKGVDLMGKANDGFADMQMKMSKKDAGNHSMYEAFSGGWITFAITDNSLVFGKEEFPYGQLDEIVLTVPPTKMRVGAAQTKVGDRTLLLQYALGQAERFATAVAYANEQIAQARGIVKDYKYLLQTPSGNRIEAYDTYLMLYAISGGFLADTMTGGQVGQVLEYSAIQGNVSFDPQTGEPTFTINDRASGDPLFTTSFLRQDVEKAQGIVQLMDSSAAIVPTGPVMLEPWAPFNGEARQFVLNGEALAIDASMDSFNTYRQLFYGYANTCVEAGITEYLAQVRDLITCLKFFPAIYGKNLDVLIERAVDALISSGVYTMTADAFKERHLSEFHSAIDVLEATMESVALTSQANVKTVESVTNLVPNLIGGGFGTKGALKGILKAEAFNLARDTAENALLENASKINPSQAKEIYERIVPEQLFALVFSDYWNVHLTLAQILNEAGKPTWWISEAQAQQAQGIFQNLSNPNFPQEQLTPMFIEILKTNPYRKEYHQYMVGKFGENEETGQIRNYFGFSDLENMRLD